MRNAFGMIAADGRVTYVNSAFAKLFGARADQLIGISLLDELPCVASGQRMRDRIASRRDGKSEDYEIEVRIAKGRRVSAVVRPTPMFGSDGTFLGSFAIVGRIPARERRAPERPAGKRAVPAAESALTPREGEILRDLLEGRKRSEIAAIRDISLHTVRNHVKAIYRKHGVHSQVQLVVKLRD